MRFPIDVSRSADKTTGEQLLRRLDLVPLGGEDAAEAGVGTTGRALTGARACVAHACRDAEVVCGRVELTVTTDTRLGVTARERRSFTVRFVGPVEPVLRAELTQLVRRRGAGARRAAERMEPLEIVFDDPRLGLRRIVGSIEPPQRRNDDLHDIQFGLREAAAS